MAEKLSTLRELDIFHHWDSIDEVRLCRRCGRIISGREIKVVGSRHNPAGVRLECPTEGCPSVPFEWLMLEPTAKVASQPPPEPIQPVSASRPMSNAMSRPNRLFRFGCPIL